MPEIPNVVPGEPVEADWGNDIRDRSVQKYADLTALEASQPVPQLGELAWLDNPGYLVVCTDAITPTWTPLLDQSDGDARWVEVTGDTMTGQLTTTRLRSTSVLELEGTFLHKVNAGTLAIRRDASNYFTIEGDTAKYRGPRLNEGAVLADRADGVPTPWTNIMLELGALGSIGSMGSFVAGLYGNFLRTSAGDYRSLGANGGAGASAIELEPINGHILFRSASSYGPTETAVPPTIARVTAAALQVDNGSELTLQGSGTDKLRYRNAGAAIQADRDAIWVSTGVPPNYRLDTIASLADADPVVADFFTDSPAAAALAGDHPAEGPTHRDIIQALVHEVQALRARVDALEGP